MLTQEDIKQAILNAPSLPVVVIKALELLNDDDIKMSLLRKIIETDPVIAGRILSVANSSFYGMKCKVGNLNDAFMVLGTHTIRNIVLAVGAVGAFPPATGRNIDLGCLWQHAAATAVTSKILAKQTGHNPETALIAGLLHDIGKMALDACFTHEYSTVIEYRDTEDCLLIEAEEAVLGITHCSVGSLLIERWQLPKEIVVAVKNYTQPSTENINSLADLIHVSNIMCRSLGIGDAGDSLVPALDALSMQRLGLTLTDIENSLTEIDEAATASAALIS